MTRGSSFPRIAAFACVVVAALSLSAVADRPSAESKDPVTLFPVTLFTVQGEPELLATRLSGLPVRIRFAGLGWALIEVSESDLAAVRDRLPSAKKLRRAEAPLRLLALPESELTAAGRAECDPLTLLVNRAEDLRVLAMPMTAGEEEGIATWVRGKPIRGAEHIAGVHALPLPESISPRALAPLPASERANPYRQSRLHDHATRVRAIALAGQVDSARIMRHVRELSTGPGATRFSCRDEINSFAAQYLLDTLRSIFSAPEDQVFAHSFTIGPPRCDPAADLSNLIARRPGNRPGSGRYILCAHYDATASNTPGWNPATDPAPGADDNLSGVASVIEAARILINERYDFDLEVALFSGEEQGLIGSTAYAADSVAQVEEVLGVINLDMVGFNPRAADSMNAVTNLTSEWLADLVIEAEQVLSEEHGLNELDKIVAAAFARSDHAPFWHHGQSAILLIENILIDRHNPNYHRTSDTFEALAATEGGDLIRRVTETAVATIGQFAISSTPEVSFSIPELGILCYRPDGAFLIDAVVGQDVNVRVRVINDGASLSGSARVTGALSVGGGAGVAHVDTSFAGWGTGVWREILFHWTPTPDQIGDQSLRADLTLSKDGIPLATLAGSTTFEVNALRLLRAVVAPNPIRGSLAAGALRLEQLNGQADLSCRVIDALGGEVGGFEGRVLQGQPIPMERIVTNPDLPSGVYVLMLDLKVPAQTATVLSEKITFAFMR